MILYLRTGIVFAIFAIPLSLLVFAKNSWLVYAINTGIWNHIAEHKQCKNQRKWTKTQLMKYFQFFFLRWKFGSHVSLYQRSDVNIYASRCYLCDLQHRKGEFQNLLEWKFYWLCFFAAASHKTAILERNLLFFLGWCRVQSSASDPNHQTWKPSSRCVADYQPCNHFGFCIRSFHSPLLA